MKNRKNIPVVVMAGGKGTRIASVDATIPKPMLKVANKPILEHQIECLAKQGITNITIVIGHLGEIISDYFGNGEKFGVHINYFTEDKPLGTAGVIRHLDIADDFLLLNGDLLFNFDVHKFHEAHRKHAAQATIAAHPNDHPFDSEIIVTDENSKVVQWLHRGSDRGWYRNNVNAGLHFLSPGILDYLPDSEVVNLDKDLLQPLIEDGKLHAYSTFEFIMDVGTPDRLLKAEYAVNAGRLSNSEQKKAVFLDRDGTINKHMGFLSNIDDFMLLDGVSEGIRILNQLGYIIIVVTNQPIIARGESDWDCLRMIHNKMETLLGQNGAFVNDIFICPHHPDQGFDGERAEYKIDCDCRKPKPGLLLKAAEKYDIDLSESWMVGDRDIDIQAGISARCKTAFIGDSEYYGLRFDNLNEFAKFIS